MVKGVFGKIKSKFDKRDINSKPTINPHIYLVTLSRTDQDISGGPMSAY